MNFAASTPAPTVQANATCPGNCMGHGVCFEGQCYCSSLYSGADCSVPRISSLIGLFCPGDCSGRGVCDNGRCICDYGFGGDDCSVTMLSYCPSNCSMRGVCSNSTCFCDRGWTGVDCSTPICEPGMSRIC
jgi:syndecan 4